MEEDALEKLAVMGSEELATKLAVVSEPFITPDHPSKR
jgi:hypothetical protein